MHVLSLAECRRITEDGLLKLRKLPLLKSLNLLGCVHINDDAVALVTLGNFFLEELDLSGTCITKVGLLAIKDNCQYLKRLKASACRNLEQTDSAIFSHIDIDISEDSVRFYLQPSKDSRLQKFTNNILRTRRSLSVHRIAQFVQRRLVLDSEIDVLYDGKCLAHYICLNELKFEDTISLFYRLKEETLEIEEAYARNRWAGERPEWISDEETDFCLRCHRRFSFFSRKHHCRRCGKVCLLYTSDAADE